MSSHRLPVAVCVINYQGRAVLTETLEAIRAQRPSPSRIILVDNASEDGSAEMVRDRFAEVEVIRLAANRGPGPAREAGFAAAGSRYVCMIDNDVAPEPGCLARLAEALAADPAAALAMPRIVHAHDPARIQYDGAIAHFLGVMAIENQEVPRDCSSCVVHPIGSIIGACFLVDRMRWGDHPLQSEGFFIYHEDHDLGLRARQLGLGILSVPSAVCRHGKGTADLSIRATGTFTERRVLCTIANRWRIILMRYQLRTIFLLAPTFALFELLQFAGSLKKGWHRHWQAAARTIWRERQTIMAERRAWQAKRRLSDGEVLLGGPPPFHPKLLEGRVEQLGYWCLSRLGDLNWRLALPLLKMGWPRSIGTPPAVAHGRAGKNEREA
ncbi:glycosyltransferase family 2 protein [Geminicoccus roseus]|uniref:glycosyltransferase family 2 protein n=1 Tax=Geminicoccus roseus TaxID=404900 RepID=UPI000414AFBF|nr:glycosyltransferase [Geminicoccus roseus]